MVRHEVIVQRIAETATSQVLKVRAELDTTCYPVGNKITDEELAGVNFKPHDFHGDWNYNNFPTRAEN